MVDSDPLLDLLVRWEEERAQGRLVSPETLCPDNMALQEELRQRIGQRERYRDLWTLVSPTTPVHESTATTAGPLEGLEILGVLGQGGMGVVYKARQCKLDRLVAVKVIRAGTHAGPEEQSRFRREAEAIARLHHPNIVEIYEVGEKENCPYVVLKLVSGSPVTIRQSSI